MDQIGLYAAYNLDVVKIRAVGLDVDIGGCFINGFGTKEPIGALVVSQNSDRYVALDVERFA